MADNGSMAPPSRPQREGTPIPSEPPSSQAHPGQISDFTPPNRSRIKSKDDIFDDEDFEDHAGSHRSSSTYRRAGEIGTNNEVEADAEMTEGVDFGNNGSASEYPEEESNEIELPRSPAAADLDDTQSLALSHDNEHFEENGSPHIAQQLDGHSSDRESRQQDRNELNGDRDDDDVPFDSNFDWNDLYGRFNAEMQQKHREEEELRVQYMQLMDVSLDCSSVRMLFA